MTPAAKINYQDSQKVIAQKTDYTFAALLCLEWLIGIVLAFGLTPKSWSGSVSSVHVHVYLAIFLGLVLAIIPSYQIIRNPGATINRHYAVVAQSLFSILFIHLTGGRIETHFHIFVSLAFMAFYLDWRVLIAPTLITFIDHLVRGYFVPESIYGVSEAGMWRAYEHAAWVVFEDIVVAYLIYNGQQMLKALAMKQAELQEALSSVEERVLLRTKELEYSREQILSQQQLLISASKMSSLGEMAGGIAHEINNPLAVISMFTEQIEDELEAEVIDKEQVKSVLNQVDSTISRISKIISGLRSFARDGALDDMTQISVKKVIDETMVFCAERIKKSGIKLQIDPVEENLSFFGRSTEISQVLLNLLNNATDAINERKDSERWIRVSVESKNNFLLLSVTDSGNGISDTVSAKMFDPFFTTKEIGQGTGMGLSISMGIIKAHGGKLFINKDKANTTFTMELAKEKTK